MPTARCARLACLPALALTLGACAPHPHAAAPAPAFPTTDAAMACAREALASAGFLPQAPLEPPVGQRSIATAADTPTSVTRQIVTPLGEGRQVDFVGVDAHIQVGSQQDTTVTLQVRAGTVVSQDQAGGATVQPLSTIAVRGRDAVVTQCHAAVQSGTYPRSS